MYLAHLFRAFAAWRQYRIAARELSELDDRMLQDLGLNRTQIKQVARYGR